jgi:hypothetical protein
MPDQELEQLLHAMDDCEATLEVDWSVKPTQIRVVFADEVALNLALNKHDPNELKPQLAASHVLDETWSSAPGRTWWPAAQPNAPSAAARCAPQVVMRPAAAT